MFEVSNRLVGIYKTEDCTKSVTIDNKLPDQPSNNTNTNGETATNVEVPDNRLVSGAVPAHNVVLTNGQVPANDIVS